MMKTQDLTNKLFGNWKVLYQVEDKITPNGNHQPMWMCECQCEQHTNKVINAYSLKRGKSKSCGCMLGELKRQTIAKYNKYDLSGEYGIGYTSNTNKQFYFDLEDFDKIKDYCWSEDTSTKYIKTVIQKEKIYLHRYILNCKYGDNKIIDHINRERNDCRKENLRTVNNTQNAINKGLKINNTSGKTGISFSKSHQKWECYITINKKRKHLGLYDNFNDAVKARKEAEEKYFGEYNPIPNLKEGDEN